MKRIITRLLIPVAILGGGVAGTAIMVKTAESAEQDPPAAAPPQVEVATAQSGRHQPVVSGTGPVEAARSMTLIPEVSGRIVELSPEMVVGGRVHEGDVLVRIDDRNYRLAIKQQRSQVSQAKLELEVEEGRGRSAEREWALLKESGVKVADQGRLARREPYAEAAEVSVSSARSTLSRSKLDLTRTVIKAPFNATITTESVEVGQVVGANSVLAELVGSDEVWVRVSVPIESLLLLDVPERGSDVQGSRATVIQTLRGGKTATWEGRVVRLVNGLDPDTRLAQLIVAVENPLARSESQPLPLVPDAFVRVELEGPAMSDVVQVPREVVFEGKYVWVVGEDDRLERRALNVEWADDDHLYVKSGLTHGERYVVQEPPNVLDGMKIEPVETASKGGVGSLAVAETGDDQ